MKHMVKLNAVMPGTMSYWKCLDTGWLIEAKDKNGVVTMELIPCLIPDCKKSGQTVELLSLDCMRLAGNCVHHPKDGYLMSVRAR